MKLTARIGPVYHGPQDARHVLGVLIGELRLHDTERHDANIQLLKLAQNALESDTFDQARSQDVVSQVQDALQQFAPPFCYFGAHPDNHEELGWWPDWPSILDLEPVYSVDQAARSTGWVRQEYGERTIALWHNGQKQLDLPTTEEVH